MTKYRLDQIGKVIGGGTPSTRKKQYYANKGIAWITPKDLSGYSKMYISHGARDISQEGLDNSSAKLLPKDTVLVSSRAPIGYVALAANKITTNQGFKSIVPNTDIVLPKYLYYLMLTKKDELENVSSGSTFKEVSGRVMKGFEVDIPSLDKQANIIQKIEPITRKIELNYQINANLTNQLNSMFDKMYYESSSRIELMNFISEMKSGDWGKAKLTDNFIKPAVIIRGTDFCNVANGQKSDAPIRYLKTATIQKKHLIANDVLIEISGGSPTQSTGRSLLITDKLLNRYNTPVLGTNFTRLFRCETEENAVLFHSYINFLYNKNVFFNYENGTTGIKNLDYKSILKINVNDVQKHSLFPKYFSMYHFYESMKQHLGDESTVLTCLKEQLLRKFF